MDRQILDELYRPLRPVDSEIRLLELCPSTLEDDPLVCEIRYVSLVRPPCYRALSYCWGDQSHRTLITVNGTEVSITSSLSLALRRMRQFGFTSLWVDALCINQADLVERSAQVIRMSAIYKEATAVIVWLGQATNGSDRIMRTLQRLQEGTEVPLVHHEPPNSKAAEGRNVTWTEIDHFLTRPYWSRLWIIQEIAAASRVMLACGDHIVDWDQVELLFEKLATGRTTSSQQLSLVQNLNLTRSDRIESKPVSLLECLSRSHRSQSTDSRDKVFGILGLAFDRSNFVSEPNYNLSPAALCQSMTESAIRSKRSLDLLLLRQSYPLQSDLPTWCPDYLNLNTHSFNPDLLRYVSGNDTRHRLGQLLPRWSATANSRAVHSTLSFTNGILLTQGYQLGTIVSLGRTLNDPFFSSPTNPQSQPQQFPQHDSILSCSIPPTSSHPFKSLCRMLLLYALRRRSTDLPPLLLSLYTGEARTRLIGRWTHDAADADYIKRWLDVNATFVLGGRKLTDWIVSWHAIQTQSQATSLWDLPAKVAAVFDSRRVQTVASVLREGMRVMELTDGQVGWGCEGARLGDKVFLLQGCSVPVVLRHVVGEGRGFEFVGNACVDGVMMGEVWRGGGEKRKVDVWIR